MVHKLLSFSLSACALLSLAACISMTPSYIDLPEPTEHDGVVISVDRAMRAPYGYVGFYCTVTNETSQPLPECRVTIRTFDNEMEQDGRATATLQDLGPGEVREFTAKLSKSLKIVRTVKEPDVRLFWEPRPLR